jgi:ferric-dicitrate binding protein FerR (iron transport regulator)
MIADTPLLDRRAILRAGSLLGLAVVPTIPSAQTPPAGQVTDLSGEAVAERANARRALAMQEAVFVGDRVATGLAARANIRLGRTTDLRLGEETRITIDRFLVEAGGVITLGRGAVLVDRFAPGGGPVRVRSAYGLIATRGTRFYAGPNERGGFGVFVMRGEVSVDGGGRQVIVKAGEGTDIARPGAAPSESRVWGQARVDLALARVR